tara:strand:+ start:173 stop:1321 length:1149 start_codon:yes stop_codon:yes gene_type:complete
MPATANINTRSIQGEDLTAASDRLINSVLLNEGVVNTVGNSFLVAQQSSPNMTIKVGSGTAGDRAVVVGDTALQGTFIVEHQSTSVTVPVTTANASNPRVDIVVLRVYDNTFDSSGKDYSDVEVIAGSPAGSPSAPSTPASAIKLATISVAAGATTVVTANIADARTEFAVDSTASVRMDGPLTINPAGSAAIELGRVDGSSSTPVIDFHSGATAVDRDSRIIASGGTGSNTGGTLNIQAAAIQHNGVGVGTWSAWTPTLANMALGNGTITARYTQIGKTVHFTFYFILGSTSTVGASDPTVSLPVTGVLPTPHSPIGTVKFLDSGTIHNLGVVKMVSTTVFGFYVHKANSTYGVAQVLSNTIPFTWTTSDTISAIGTYEVA